MLEAESKGRILIGGSYCSDVISCPMRLLSRQGRLGRLCRLRLDCRDCVDCKYLEVRIRCYISLVYIFLFSDLKIS
jgi:hypothetical protein